MLYTLFTPKPQRGYVLLLALVFLGVFITIATAYVNFVTTSARSVRYDIASAQALAIAEAGLDKTAYELNLNTAYSGETNTTLDTGVFTVTVANIDSKTKSITAIGYVPNSTNPVATKTIKANVGITGDVISFHYGIQSGEGGFFMENSSKIMGNVFSGGPVIGTSANMIYGDVVSSGSTGLVYGVHATSSVYAHTLGKAGETTIVDKDAYYTTKVNTAVSGTSHPDSPDQETVALPISDEQIGEWETMAAAGGNATCTDGTYTISSGNVDLGPTKIPCDLVISNSAVVTVYGHIWVVGNIIVQNSAKVKMAASLGAQNVAIIADNPSNQLTSSTISVRNTASFENSGTVGSYVFLISQNRSAETGGEIAAFELSNSASAIVAYAAHGLIPLANTVALKEATAYKIHLQNSASVTYDTGLPSSVFETGSGGSWTFIPGSYAIIK